MAHPAISFDKEQHMPTQNQEPAFSGNRNKNFGLTQVEFVRLVQELKNGNEQLIKKCYLAHFEKCTTYLIKQCGAKYEQAYTSTMDALIEIRIDLIKEKIQYGNLAYYFTVRAKKKLSKLSNKASKKVALTAIEDMDFQGSTDLQKEFLTKEMTTLVQKALKDLCGDCRKLLRQHYFEELTFVEIGASSQKNAATIRQQAKRCRDKLKGILEKMLY